MDDIPQWACDSADEGAVKHGYRYALAAHIFKHEKPPVDPLEAEATAIYNMWTHYDIGTVRTAVMAALRRGIELGKQS